jgi:hypothetical protein
MTISLTLRYNSIAGQFFTLKKTSGHGHGALLLSRENEAVNRLILCTRKAVRRFWRRQSEPGKIRIGAQYSALKSHFNMAPEAKLSGGK